MLKDKPRATENKIPAVFNRCGIVPREANLGRRLGGRSMSRRSGQCGSIERKKHYYVVRFWQDVAGREKRVHRSVRICPVSGTGTMTKPERERRAREIIIESGEYGGTFPPSTGCEPRHHVRATIGMVAPSLTGEETQTSEAAYHLILDESPEMDQLTIRRYGAF